MTLSKSSFFTASTEYFDICVSLYVNQQGRDMQSLLPIQNIARLGTIDRDCSSIITTDGAILRVALPLMELYKKLKTVRADTGVIDLLAETSAAALEKTAVDTLSATFNEACQGTPGIDYVELRCFATAPYKSEEPFELLLRYAKAEVRAERLDNRYVDHTFLSFREQQGERNIFNIPMPFNRFSALIDDAFAGQKKCVDIREATKGAYKSAITEQVLLP